MILVKNVQKRDKYELKVLLKCELPKMLLCGIIIKLDVR